MMCTAQEQNNFKDITELVFHTEQIHVYEDQCVYTFFRHYNTFITLAWAF